MRSLVTCLLLAAAPLALADAEADVRCREISFSQAAESRDREAFAAHIDADARFVGASVLRGVPAIVDAWSGFLSADGPQIAWRPLFVEVLENGRLALTRGPYRIIGTDGQGERIERWGTFNSVWRLNDDGSWRVVFDAGSAPDETPDDSLRALLDADPECP